MSMPSILCYTLTFIAYLGRPLNAEYCGGSLWIDPSDNGVQLDGHLILEQDEMWDLQKCTRRCISITHCLSINFSRDLRLCQLNSANRSHVDASHMVANVSFIYVDIAAWPKIQTDVCSTKPCSGSERCVPRGNSYLCLETDCAGPPPHLNEASLIPGGSVTLESTRLYVCPSERITNGNTAITCFGTSWSRPKFTCDYVRSCADLQACNSGYLDGEYWLYPTPYGNTPVRIYCHGLATMEPKAFVTVSPTENKAEVGASSEANRRRLDFTKIQVDTETMIVNRTDLTFATYSSVSGFDLWYGVAVECECESWCSPALGTFRIDTSTTGLIFDPSLVWLASGYSGVLRDFVRSADNTVISLRCGGYCGVCNTLSDMTLQLNPLYAVDPSEATFPMCT